MTPTAPDRPETSDAIDPCLAVIPARGGSKGLPGKNIRPLAGVPLIEHALRFARMMPRIARTVVSTDSEEIAAVARAAGGDVPFMRPAELATDTVSLMPTLRHALEEVERREGRRYGSFLLLDPTSPFRLPEDLDEAFALLEDDPKARGVVESDGYMTRAFEGDKVNRRQSAPRFYRINGTLYLWRTELIRRAPDGWLDEPHRLLEIPEARAFSIDDLFQFDLAQMYLDRGIVKLPWL